MMIEKIDRKMARHGKYSFKWQDTENNLLNGKKRKIFFY